MNEVQRLYAEAVEALNRGDWNKAWELGNRLLPLAPNHGGVQFVAGVAAMQLQRFPEALRHLQRAVQLNPKRADYAAQFAKVLAAGRMMRQALDIADIAVRLGPEDAMTLDTLGVIFTQGNQHEKAAELFAKASKQAPGRASHHFNLGTSLLFAGRLDEAEREYEACIASNPRYWKAHLALSKLRKVGAQDNHLERLQSLLAEQDADAADANMYLNLAISKELEDLGDYPAAFARLVAGKSAGRAGRHYDSSRDQALFGAITDAFAEPVVDDGGGSDSREPIFVIGMPRTGTTLVDRILSSHPDVHSAGELQNFGVVLKRASGSPTPGLIDSDTIRRLRAAPWREIGDAYVESTRPGTGSLPHFVDKLPHNFLYAGFIAKALPKARIVCLRRNPLDSCLGNFRQLFAQDTPYYDYSFDLLDTGRYYLMFDALMRHWRTVLPGRVLEIDYEAIVAEQEQSTRSILAHCGLAWDDACLRFVDNAAPVATASAVQVRQPLHREAIGRWRRYEAELSGLRAMFEEAGIAVD